MPECKPADKKAVTFLKKSNQKTFDFPRLLSGHGLAAQKPAASKKRPLASYAGVAHA